MSPQLIVSQRFQVDFLLGLERLANNQTLVFRLDILAVLVVGHSTRAQMTIIRLEPIIIDSKDISPVNNTIVEEATQIKDSPVKALAHTIITKATQIKDNLVKALVHTLVAAVEQ